jgi:hypothetical protein
MRSVKAKSLAEKRMDVVAGLVPCSRPVATNQPRPGEREIVVTRERFVRVIS